MDVTHPNQFYLVFSQNSNAPRKRVRILLILLCQRVDAYPLYTVRSQTVKCMPRWLDGYHCEFKVLFDDSGFFHVTWRN